MINAIRLFFVYFYAFIVSLAPVSKFSEGVVGQPNAFTPDQAKSSNDLTISRLLFRGLFKYDIYGTLQPDLAETWSISEDGLVYTIKLKDDQYWIDGSKISSDDLIYTAFSIPDLAYVATDKVDDLTVRYTLPNKYSPFLNLLTVGVIKSGLGKNQDPLKPISSGDFRLGRIEKSGKLVKQVVLVKTKKNANISKLVFKYYKDEKELLTAAKLGEIEGFTSSDEQSLENFTDYKFPLQGIYYALFFNLRNDKFKDKAVREKIQKALPIVKIIRDVGIVVEGPISRSSFNDNAINFNKFDETFNEDMSTVEFKLTIPDTKEHRETAQIIRQELKNRAGIKVSIEAIEPSKMTSDIIEPRNFETLLYGQEVSRDPDRYVYWHSEQKNSPGLNITGFEHMRADRALEEGRNETNNDKRVIHYNEVQKVIADQIPAIFLYHPYVHYYINKHFEGVGDKYTYTYADRYLDMDNWKRTGTN